MVCEQNTNSAKERACAQNTDEGFFGFFEKVDTQIAPQIIPNEAPVIVSPIILEDPLAEADNTNSQTSVVEPAKPQKTKALAKIKSESKESGSIRVDTLKIDSLVSIVGERILAGSAYIAPGDKHMEIVKSGADYKVSVNDGQLVSGHKPAVDLIIESLAKVVGINAIATLLTGMGKDGATGLLSMYESGAITMVQDEKTSVMWGMPRAAAEIGATKHIFPLDKMSNALTKALEKKGGGTRL